jgi:phosphopentomutase
MSNGLRRVVVLVLDSVGAGALPDAGKFGDEGADTLGHALEASPDISLPNLARLGLGNALSLLKPRPIEPVEKPSASFGLMREASPGKDTITGHWEMMGLVLKRSFPVFHNGFPEEIISRFAGETGRGILGNKPASGTAIIDELAPEQARTGKWIVYTSADSVFQIAAHEKTIPLAELYAACRTARKILDPYLVSRVIARPFIGTPGAYSRTYNRRDFSMPPSSPTVLDALCAAGVEVVGIGKIWDIFAGRGVSRQVHTEGNSDGLARTIEEMAATGRNGGSRFIFVNLVDFDSAWGHRRNPKGYAMGLKEVDDALPAIMQALGPQDLLIITADHGCDPSFTRHTDHTREYVPLLAYSAGANAVTLGFRSTFADIGATVAEVYGTAAPENGTSFLQNIRKQR